VTRFGWDEQGRLRTETTPAGATTRFRYDPLGRRVAAESSDQTSVQTYGLDPNPVAETIDGVETRYTFGVGYDVPLAMERTGTPTYFSQDALSSVTSVTSQAGAVTGRYSYDTDGQLVSSIGVSSPFLFTGRGWDGRAGVYDFRARQYDPATGRFLSEDPVPSVNAYAYSNGVPTVLSDPTGRTTEAETAETTFWSDVLSSARWGASINAGIALRRGIQCGESGFELIESVALAAGRGALTGGVGKAIYRAGYKGLAQLELVSGLAGKDSPHLWDDPSLYDLGLAIANLGGRWNAPAGRAGTAEEQDGKAAERGC
jgi:RHS repeat-associated protein